MYQVRVSGGKDSAGCVSFSGSPVRFYGAEAGGLTAFTIPVVARREVPKDLDQILERLGSQATDSMVAGMSSHLVALLPTVGSRALAIHQDVTVQRDLLSTSSWVTILDLQRRQACVDRPLPSSGTGRPVFAARGDTLVVVEQRLGTARPDAGEVWRTRYLVTDEACAWRVLGAPGGEVP